MPRVRNIDPSNLPPWIDRPEKVTNAEMIQYRNLKGVVEDLDSQYPDGWNDDDLRRYIIKGRQEKIGRALANIQVDRVSHEAHEAQVKSIVESYLKNFADPTPNDMVALTEMARIQLTLELLDERLKVLAYARNPSAGDIKTISDVRKNALTAFQSLEKGLGIDRESRGSESDVVSIVQGIRAEARELINQRGRQIVCRHCKEDGFIFNLGIILFHLDANGVSWRFEFTCPRCNNFATLGTGQPNF